MEEGQEAGAQLEGELSNESPPEVVDPGQEEGRPKKVEGPPEGSPRWNEIYYKAKELDRKMEEFEKQQKESSTLKESFDLLSEQNKKLMESIEKQTSTVVDSLKQSQDSPQGDPVGELDAQIIALRAQKKEAANDGDHALVSELQDTIMDLISTKGQIQQQQDQKKLSTEITTDLSKKTYQDTVDNFIKQTPWLQRADPSYDPVMEATAIALNDMYAVSWTGSDLSRFEKVREEVEKRFNFNRGAEQPPENAPPVAGASGATPPKGQKVTLTEEQKAVAMKMFRDDPDPIGTYTKQLMLLGG